MNGFDDEFLLQEFVAEGREHLSAIEPDLLILEREAEKTDSEIINRIFRAIHSIKGASGFFGLHALKSLSHSMENIFMQFRDGKLKPSADAMDPLLLGVDRLRLMFEDIHASETVAYQDVVTDLENLMGIVPSVVNAKALSALNKETEEKQAPLSSLTADPVLVEEAIRYGQKLYHINLSIDAYLASSSNTLMSFYELLTSTGTVLGSSLDVDNLASLPAVSSSLSKWDLFYASVLETDLILITFDLTDSECREIQASDLTSSISSSSPSPVKDETFHKEAVLEAKNMETVSAPIQELPKSTMVTKPTSSASSESNETIRVKVELLNRLMDLAGELVLARNQLTRIFESQGNQTSEMSGIIQNVDLVTSDLQEHIMQTRMQAISSVFGKFPRLVRDLSRQLNKEIELKMSGEEVELDKSILESLSDPLTHLIRNCCDHAMELPDTREEAGKPRQGTVCLKAYQESGHINIAIIDDGAGIDHERIARKALESGIITEASLRQMSPQEQVNLIFLPGFSTAEKVTDVSGRGVGMDVVRTNIEQIGGSISITTEKGKGTTIFLRLPLTLAIIPSLVVKTCAQSYAVPQINLVELVCVKTSQIATRIEKVGSASVLRLRGKLLPLIKLSHSLGLEDEVNDQLISEKRNVLHDQRIALVEDLLQEEAAHIPVDLLPSERRQSPQSDYNILVLKAGSRQYGLIVDEICDIEEIVVKPLSSFIKNCKCFSGATIMGDGTVSMILDVAGLILTSGLSFSELDSDEPSRDLRIASIATNESRSMLLFNNTATEVFALPIDSILRVEKIQLSAIEQVGQHKFLPYQGKPMSLTLLDAHLPVSGIPQELQEAYLIIPKSSTYRTGLVVSNILDTVEFCDSLEATPLKHPGISGSAVINQHVTLFVNWEGLKKESDALRPESLTFA